MITLAKNGINANLVCSVRNSVCMPVIHVCVCVTGYTHIHIYNKRVYIYAAPGACMRAPQSLFSICWGRSAHTIHPYFSGNFYLLNLCIKFDFCHRYHLFLNNLH